MRFKDKAVLVTGAQQGIGAATAVAFAREGAAVAINFLDDAAAAARVAAEVTRAGGRATALRGDVTRAADAAALAAGTLAAFGRLDVLVNNAGVFPRQAFLDMTERDWDFVLGVNLKGSFLCAQAAARAMIAGGRGGAIVNLSSSAVRGRPRAVHYSTTKAGLIGFTRSLALELAPHRIRVNAVAPGLTDTAQPRVEYDEAAMQEMSRQVPLGRMATADEIAGVIAFLGSDQAGQITGQVVHVNGGSYMG